MFTNDRNDEKGQVPAVAWVLEGDVTAGARCQNAGGAGLASALWGPLSDSREESRNGPGGRCSVGGERLTASQE